ncbi:MAG: hypothetical protein IKD47_05845 [Clostridia bacterium]|nr:hypothetical protein [Clostridia bacterium]
MKKNAKIMYQRCSYLWKQIGKYRKAKAPCPKCKSWNTTVENGIFYCADCGFEGG